VGHARRRPPGSYAVMATRAKLGGAKYPVKAGEPDMLKELSDKWDAWARRCQGLPYPEGKK